MAKANPFRFSTKYTDEETELVCYGYRYYSPTLGRWLSRDPLGEKGELNLYGFIGNNPISFVDVLGLDRYGNPVSGPNGPEGPSDTDPSIFLPPELQPKNGFIVVGSDIDIDYVGQVLAIVGVDHVDIAYNGSVVYVGKGGNAGRKGNKVSKTNHQYQLSKRQSGMLKYGEKAKCLACKDATDADILDCLAKRKPSPGKNCQGDVQDAVGDCCLSGFRMIVGTLLPYLSD